MDITLNLRKPVQSLSGLPLEGADNMGKLLAGSLSQSSSGDSLKFFNWAVKLYAGESIKIDESDYKTLEEFVKGKDHPLTNLVKAQILKEMASARVQAEKKIT